MRLLFTALLFSALSACDGDGGASRDEDAAFEKPDGNGVGALDGGPDGAAREDAASGSDGSCAPAEQAVTVMGQLHVAGDIVYPDPPPAGGNHNACWGRWGVHDSELADERFVHNLEHGGVVFLHNCPDGCAAEVQALINIVLPRDLAIVTPYAALPTRFGVVSWGYRMLSDCFDRAAFERFYREHRDRGLESISSEPAASCL